MGILRGLVGVVAAATWAAVPTGGAAVQAWTVRPAIIIIPHGTSSGIDVLGRILAPAIAEKLGQPIVVENVGGAGGMTGAARVAKASPDGYQGDLRALAVGTATRSDQLPNVGGRHQAGMTLTSKFHKSR